jgi:hypothetical protein
MLLKKLLRLLPLFLTFTMLISLTVSVALIEEVIAVYGESDVHATCAVTTLLVFLLSSSALYCLCTDERGHTGSGAERREKAGSLSQPVRPADVRWVRGARRPHAPRATPEQPARGTQNSPLPTIKASSYNQSSR